MEQKPIGNKSYTQCGFFRKIGVSKILKHIGMLIVMRFLTPTLSIAKTLLVSFDKKWIEFYL